MSLVVSCRDCVHPVNSRQVVQWPQNCSICAEDLIARHLLEFPDHRVELTGRISERPFGGGAQQNIQRLFGKRAS